MSGTRWLLAVLALVVLSAPATAGLFPRKSKSDARVRQLTETLKSDPDEKKRRAAVVELRDADPRTQPDVIPALVAALQRDRVAHVRADAAEALGQFKQVYPFAGVALETAAESDSSPAVRDAAQQALWEYHINGYRSAKGADGIAGQTPEPPLAKPVARPTIVPVSAGNVIPAPPPAPTPPSPELPTVAPLPPPPRVGPTIFTLPPLLKRPLLTKPIAARPSNSRSPVSSAPPITLNVTAEPPLAKSPTPNVTPPTTPTIAPKPADIPVPLPTIPQIPRPMQSGK